MAKKKETNKTTVVLSPCDVIRDSDGNISYVVMQPIEANETYGIIFNALIEKLPDHNTGVAYQICVTPRMIGKMLDCVNGSIIGVHAGYVYTYVKDTYGLYKTDAVVTTREKEPVWEFGLSPIVGIDIQDADEIQCSSVVFQSDAKIPPVTVKFVCAYNALEMIRFLCKTDMKFLCDLLANNVGVKINKTRLWNHGFAMADVKQTAGERSAGLIRLNDGISSIKHNYTLEIAELVQHFTGRDIDYIHMDETDMMELDIAGAMKVFKHDERIMQLPTFDTDKYVTGESEELFIPVPVCLKSGDKIIARLIPNGDGTTRLQMLDYKRPYISFEIDLFTQFGVGVYEAHAIIDEVDPDFSEMISDEIIKNTMINDVFPVTTTYTASHAKNRIYNNPNLYVMNAMFGIDLCLARPNNDFDPKDDVFYIVPKDHKEDLGILAELHVADGEIYAIKENPSQTELLFGDRAPYFTASMFQLPWIGLKIKFHPVNPYSNAGLKAATQVTDETLNEDSSEDTAGDEEAKESNERVINMRFVENKAGFDIYENELTDALNANYRSDDPNEKFIMIEWESHSYMCGYEKHLAIGYTGEYGIFTFHRLVLSHDGKITGWTEYNTVSDDKTGFEECMDKVLNWFIDYEIKYPTKKSEENEGASEDTNTTGRLGFSEATTQVFDQMVVFAKLRKDRPHSNDHVSLKNMSGAIKKLDELEDLLQEVIDEFTSDIDTSVSKFKDHINDLKKQLTENK